MSYQITLQDCINDSTTTFDIDAFDVIQQQVPQYLDGDGEEEDDEEKPSHFGCAQLLDQSGGAPGASAGETKLKVVQVDESGSGKKSSSKNSENSILVKFESVEEQDDGGDLTVKCWADIGATTRDATGVTVPLAICEPT
uniref:(northern house mosquito) hypothetical protein n=1 Tax=Culex pipiens TaxID=7175 RepID=A0A8D8MQ94_CULPI